MTIHWITFRIADETVGGKTYSERYNALIAAVKEHRTNWWFEPTSFWLVESASTRSSLAASIKKSIATSKDLVLIGSLEHTGATLIGTAEKLATLKQMVPDLVVA